MDEAPAAAVPIDAPPAGRFEPDRRVIRMVGADRASVTLRAEAAVDRTEFGMTWSPLWMAGHQARVVITARFVRA